MDKTSLEKRIQDIENREAIKELFANYCWNIDSGSYEEFLDLFTDDVTCDFGDIGSFNNKEEWKEFVYHVLPVALPGMRHLIHNEIIELNGERARGRAYFEFTGVNNEKSFVGGGYYEHEVVKVGGQWKFKKVKAVIQYMAPLAEGWASGFGFSGVKGLVLG